jgi:hypothetical protein
MASIGFWSAFGGWAWAGGCVACGGGDGCVDCAIAGAASSVEAIKAAKSSVLVMDIS